MKKELIINENKSIKYLIKEPTDKDIKLKLLFGKPSLSLNIYIIAICNNGQQHSVDIDVTHNKPNCSSEIKVISFVKGKGSKFNWIANVIVKKNATTSKTIQFNKNYLFSKNATVFAMPNLGNETDADARHKSIIVDKDDELFFYLQAKGLSKNIIEKLLIDSYISQM